MRPDDCCWPDCRFYCGAPCPYDTERPTHHFVGSNVGVLIAVVVVFVIAALLAGCVPSKASSIDEDTPDMAAYYESLMQPNNDTSCCGPGDAYYADKVDACKPHELEYDKDCVFVAIITDTRPDIRMVGAKAIKRVHLPVGTRIIIPSYKVRKHPIPNPTDHNVVFVSVSDFGINGAICWEPVAGL